MEPDEVNLWYFKLRLFDLTVYSVWNILGPRHWVMGCKDIGIVKSEFVANTQFL